MTRVIVLAAVLLAGCFDSLLDAPCREGFLASGGKCVLANNTNPDGGGPGLDGGILVGGDSGTDGGSGSGSDGGSGGGSDGGTDGGVVVMDGGSGGPDAPVCTAIPDDPMNCGACGRVCSSGICAGSSCVGNPAGHVIAIGHDYATTNAPARRVLANAASMGRSLDLAIARWGSSSTVTNALTTSLAGVGRSWHAVARPTQPSVNAFAGIDVIVVDPNIGDGDGAASEAEGASWQAAFTTFLDDGGVVIILDNASGTSVRFAHGAGLFTTSAPPVTVTGQHLSVVAPTDAVVQQVLSPYFAASSTVAFPGLPAVVATGDGTAVVFHAATP